MTLLLIYLTIAIGVSLLGSEIVDEGDTVEDLQAFAKEEFRNRIREDKN